MKKADRVYVLGTGNQAPYGIGEIIEIIPKAHIRKIVAAVSEYHNPPALRLNSTTGPRLDIRWDQDEKYPVLEERPN